MRKSSVSYLLLAAMGLTGCGSDSSSSSQTTKESQQGSIVTTDVNDSFFTPEPMSIQVDLANQLSATIPDDQLFDVAVNFDLNNSGDIDEGDIQVRMKRIGTGWTNTTSNLYYIFVQGGGNTVVFDESPNFKSESGRITSLGVKSVGTIEQTDNAGKTALRFDLIKNPQRSLSGDLNGSDAVYSAFELALSQISASTPVNASVGLADQSTTPATSVSFDQVPDGETYFQGSNASIEDNLSDYTGVSGEADIEKVVVGFAD
ncbi:hypothetical protein Q4491_04040 [Photobacterium sp. 2_MG-2023]|uniref:hypothetical protein n=1 Tax=Photobacterium sp. 2_MG-2023 TaxID=3062663 RepID=UPI0026E11651|nr:hypothetical protein [Photobacterium sp. 2_MG-2023]MDO6580507.1 hypothetical protein [Photobacterium sp. 2_MG-2023]